VRRAAVSAGASDRVLAQPGKRATGRLKGVAGILRLTAALPRGNELRSEMEILQTIACRATARIPRSRD
jgi:hypothetical protein